MFSEEKQDDRPSILVIAGPNGSGKSTVTKGLPVIGLYVNADEIKKAAKCSDLEAAQEAEIIRRALLKARQDFTFETVLSTERNLFLLEEAEKNGYQICAVFVLTKDSAVNVRRVRTPVCSQLPIVKKCNRVNYESGRILYVPPGKAGFYIRRGLHPRHFFPSGCSAFFPGIYGDRLCGPFKRGKYRFFKAGKEGSYSRSDCDHHKYCLCRLCI